MATLQALILLSSSSRVSSSSCVVGCSFRHNLYPAVRLKTSRLSLSTAANINNNNITTQELVQMGGTKSQQVPVLPLLPSLSQTITTSQARSQQPAKEEEEEEEEEKYLLLAKLYAIAEAVADRAEMHTNIGEQRNNWNILFLHSINAITLTASTMAALASLTFPVWASLSLRVSSTILYSAATAILLLVNKIQPSQLAEEQRNAARLFRNLHTRIQNHLALENLTTPAYINRAMASVLALDKAYPLPLLPGMLDKFPAKVEPAVWWRPFDSQQKQQFERKKNNNGWSEELDERLAGIVRLLKEKDIAGYMRLSLLVLRVNRILAIAGPLLTGAAALGAAFGGSAGGVVGVVGGVLGCLVNVVQHGGQVGMVFELYRNCAGYYRLLVETIEYSLSEEEEDRERRENGELLEMKVALQLGRSFFSLRTLASSHSSSLNRDGNGDEFAGKLF